MDLIPIREQTTIAGSPEEVWPLVADPTAVVKCIPGATLEVQRPDGVYPASITVKFGPTVATFSGEVTVIYDNAARRCTVEGRGIDERGASSALVSAVVSLSGDTDCVLVVDGGFSVAGPLETFANAGGVYVARALLAEFAANVAKLVGREQASAADASSSPPPAPAALHGGRLLWRAFAGWLRQLIFGKG